jgi:CubicO group peptidase (beta-lactamase class C family)
MKRDRWFIARRALVFAIQPLLLITPLRAESASESVFPGASWEYVEKADLEAHGWSTEGLAKTTAFIRDESNSTGLVVVDRGRVVYRFGDIEELSYVASVRKSILAMLYGFWVENGTIHLDTTLSELGFDDIGGLLPREKQAKIIHLITARSGVYHPASYSGDDLDKAPSRGSQEPGAYMLYSNWDFNVAGEVFEHLTKRSIYDEIQSQLAVPLQFEDWDRSEQHKAGDLTISKYPAYPIWISTRDMARIGYLMLNEGDWNGKQVISREWARRIKSVVTPLGEMNPVERRDGYFGYGYMWWVWDGPKAIGPFEGAYSANGAVGQWITVFPSIGLVLAHKTHNIYQRPTRRESFERIIELLFEAKGVKMPGPYPWKKATSDGS